MNEKKHDQHRHAGTHSDGNQRNQGAYWKRAHRDWRFMVAVTLMLAAMVVYVFSEDLMLRPRSQPRQPMPELSGN